MVWINYQHINESVPPGTFGGSMCACGDCADKRNKKEELSREGKDVFDLLKRCLTPYLPPVISDSKYSLEIIARTIDAYYKKRI